MLRITAILAALAASASAQTSPIDEILADRFPGAEIAKEERKAYDEAEFMTGPATREGAPEVTAEGELIRVHYKVPVDRSPLEIIRAYQRNLESKGYEKIFECKTQECGSLWSYFAENGVQIIDNRDEQRVTTYERNADGSRTLVMVVATVFDWSTGNRDDYTQVIVQAVNTAAEEADLETITAEGIAAALERDGTVSIYGLEFATDSAELSASSKPVLGQMAAFLKANTDAEVLLVGHTDNQGALDYNMSLSGRRAVSVMNALVDEYGVSKDRLGAHGVGFLAPKARNDSESGRAQNRRVEMILR